MIDSFMMDVTGMTPTQASAAVAADLVNTSARVWPSDRLDGLPALRAFLADHDIAPGDPTDDDLAQVRSLRDDLREVFVADDDRAAVAVLNDLLAAADARPRLVDLDGWRWQLIPPDDAGPVQRLATAAAGGVLELIRAGGRDRLGLCAAHGCAGVYVDLTRNRSRRYCSPEICGNRTNLAAFRARRRAAEPG